MPVLWSGRADIEKNAKLAGVMWKKCDACSKERRKVGVSGGICGGWTMGRVPLVAARQDMPCLC